MLTTFKERDHWMRRMIADPELTAAAKLLGARLALYLRLETGLLDPKINCLVSATGLNARTIGSAIKALQARGWLRAEREQGHGRYLYALLLPGEKFAPRPEKNAPAPANFAPPPGEKFAPPLKRSEEVRKACPTGVAGARAPGEKFAPAPQGEAPPPAPSDVAFRSSDGAIVYTVAEIDKWYERLPGIDHMNIVGMVGHFDDSNIEKGRTVYERRQAIRTFVLNRHTDAMNKAKASEAAAARANGASKPKPKWEERWNG